MEQGIINNIVSPEVEAQLKRLETALSRIETHIGNINTQKGGSTSVEMAKLEKALIQVQAEQKKYEDLLLKQAVTEEKLRQELEKSAQAKINTKKVEETLNQQKEKSINLAIKNQQELTKATILEEKAAQAKLRTTKSSEVKVKLSKEEATLLKLNTQLSNSAIGSYNRMSAQYSLNRIEINKWTDAEIKNSKAKQQMIKDTNKLREQMSQSQRSTGNATLDVGKYENAINKAGLAVKALVVAGVAMAAQFLKNAFTSSTQFAVEAEKSMQRLSFAIKKVGGGSDSDVALLTKQAEDLMGIFDDEAIKDAGIKMLNFGLTVKQVHQLMPLMIDAAAASGKSLEDMATAIDKGVDSGVMARSALGQLGLAFKDTGNKAENYRIIQEGLAKFTGGNTEAMKSQWGTLQNVKVRWGEVKESLGTVLLKVIVPLGEGLVNLGNIWKSTVDKIKGATDRQTLARMDDFKKELVGQKDKLKYIDQEITAERNLYKAQQNQIDINKQKIASNTAAGGAWLKNNKALEENNAGLQVGVNRHIEYINSLAGLKQELKEGAGAINLNETSLTNQTDQTDKAVVKTELLRNTIEKLTTAGKELKIALGGTGWEVIPEEKVKGINDRLAKMTEGLKGIQTETDKNAKDKADADLKLKEEKANLEKDIEQAAWDFSYDAAGAYFDWYDQRLQDQEQKNTDFYNQQLADLEAANKAGMISNADYDTQKLQIRQNEKAAQDEIDKQRKQAAKDEFLLKQAMALAEVVFNTAVNIAKMPALTGLYLGLAAVQTASIVAQSIPYFEHGGVTDKDGNIIVNERRRELVVEPSGKAYIPQTDGATMLNVPKGTTIFPDASTITNDTITRMVMLNTGSTLDTSKLEKKFDIMTAEIKKLKTDAAKPLSLMDELNIAKRLKLN